MKRRILILDDDEQDLKSIAHVLERDGYLDIALAQTAAEAVQTVRTFHPDVVIIDVVLAGPDGFDVCRQLKAIADFHSKILIITGHLDAVNAQKARTSGADEIIEKTPNFRNITKTIEELFQRQSHS